MLPTIVQVFIMGVGCDVIRDHDLNKLTFTALYYSLVRKQKHCTAQLLVCLVPTSDSPSFSSSNVSCFLLSWDMLLTLHMLFSLTSLYTLIHRFGCEAHSQGSLP